MPSTETRVLASCSFCLKPSTEVGKLIAGPGVYICDECVGLCDEILATAPGDHPPIAPWEQEVPLADVLDTLPRVARAGAQVEDNLTHWVRKARGLGATWAAIGAALGMTRQSAWSGSRARSDGPGPSARTGDRARSGVAPGRRAG